MNETTPGRFSPPPPADLDGDQQAFYQRLVHGPRGTAGDVPLAGGDGGLLGPFAVMAIAPDVGEAVAQPGAAVRYATRLEPIVREAAVLLVASYHGALPPGLTRRQSRAHAREDLAASDLPLVEPVTPVRGHDFTAMNDHHGSVT